MKSISFYMVSTFIKLSGIKKTFSKAPINFLKLRKANIKTPYKKLLLNQQFKTVNLNKSTVTEIIPVDLIEEGNIILYCPGGAFVYGPTDINWNFSAKIAKQTRLRTFLIDYPKAPEVQIQETNENIDAIFDFLAKQESVDNIILMGDSVGGTLLMLLVQRLLKSENEIKSKRLILISPVVDASMTNANIKEREKMDIMLSLNGVLSAKKMCSGKMDLKSDSISPIYNTFKNFIPTTLFIAENDIMQPDQELLVHKMRDENVDLKVYRGQGMPHIWPILPYMREAKKAFNTIIEEIKNEM